MGFSNDLCNKAFVFATQRHFGQKRKYLSEIPAIEHPSSVANRIAEFTSNPEIIAAAFLHDTLEDTTTTFEELKQRFGVRIAQLVLELTSDKDQSHRQGKAVYLSEKINHMSPAARLVKWADREHNVSELALCPLNFAQTYADQTLYIIDHLTIRPTADELVLIKSIRQKIQPFSTKRI
jgi:(p)ppGpp synthase/HD superfamily hydrolase